MTAARRRLLDLLIVIGALLICLPFWLIQKIIELRSRGMGSGLDEEPARGGDDSAVRGFEARSPPDDRPEPASTQGEEAKDD